MWDFPQISSLPAETWWPTKLPGATVQNTFDMSAISPPLSMVNLISLGAQVAPSGAGELALTKLTVAGNILTLTETAGVAGRIYWILFTAQILVAGLPLTVQFMIRQGVQEIPPPPPPFSVRLLPPPPTPGFGTELLWMLSSNNVASTGYESALLLSDIPCLLANVQVNVSDTGGWAMLVDAAAVPSPGAVAPLRWWPIQAGGSINQSFAPPLITVAGAVLLFSSNTSPFIYTPAASAIFASEVLA